MSIFYITKDLVEMFVNKTKEAEKYKTNQHVPHESLNGFRIENGNVVGLASARFYRENRPYNTIPRITFAKAIEELGIDMPVDSEYPCAWCGKTAEDGTTFDDFDICYNCTEEYTAVCEDCGERYYNTNVSYLPGVDREVCSDCSSGYICCGRCGDYFYEDNINYNDYAVEYQCDSCWEDNISPIHDYGYKPYPNFCKTEADKENPRYFGVELEIGGAGSYEDYAGRLCKIMDDGDESYIYCKSDCSIHKGFENVTHPCTLKYHMAMPWVAWMDEAKQLGYREGYSCGLHVHVNRTTFGDTRESQEEAIGNLICLVEKFWDNIAIFSRRNIEELNQWASKYGEKAYPKKKGKETAKYAKDCYDRYHAINLCNDHTIEFRIFANTLNANTLFAALQFCDVACEWAKSASEDDVDDVEFKDVFYGKYFELDEELETLNLI